MGRKRTERVRARVRVRDRETERDGEKNPVRTSRVDGMNELHHLAGATGHLGQDLRQTLVFGLVHDWQVVDDDHVVHRKLGRFIDFLLLVFARNAHIALDHDVLDSEITEGKTSGLSRRQGSLQSVGRERLVNLQSDHDGAVFSLVRDDRVCSVVYGDVNGRTIGDTQLKSRGPAGTAAGKKRSESELLIITAGAIKSRHHRAPPRGPPTRYKTHGSSPDRRPRRESARRRSSGRWRWRRPSRRAPPPSSS